MNQNDIEAMIQRYTEAEMAVLDGKSVTFNGQQMTMENLSEIRQGRQEWERRLAALITRRRGHPGYPEYSNHSHWWTNYSRITPFIWACEEFSSLA